VRGSFTQASLTGTWRIQALAACANPGWMRGTLDVAADGTVTVTSFLDNAGNTTPTALSPPVHLFVDASGQIRDTADAASAIFTGIMGSQDPKKVVGTSSSSGTQLIAVLLKHDPAVTFNPGATGVPGDINGFGGTAGGARRFAYSQVSAGASPQEWEFGQGQIGANDPAGGAQYTFGNPAQNYTFVLNASNSITRPGDKASILSLAADGTVTEALNTTAGASAPLPPPPAFVMGPGAGVMSDDKSVIVATATRAPRRPSPSPPSRPRRSRPRERERSSRP
jgi:hypothetical protein